MNTGLESLELGQAEVQVTDKKIINGTADVNQLVPIKYDWAWQKYLNACCNHWMPQEISMTQDYTQWYSNKINDQTKRIVEQALGFFSTGDSIAVNNLVLVVYRFITAPEVRQYLLRQAFEEAIHTHSYQYTIQSLSLDEKKIFNMYHQIPSIHAKDAWALKFIKSLSSADFKTGTFDSDQRLLRDLIAFYIVFEGIFFYVGFVQILTLGRQNLLVGTAEQIQYILRDESMHVNFGVDLINQIKAENPHLWTEKFQNEAINIIKKGVELEFQYAVDTIKDGVLGLNVELFDEYLKFIANRRLRQLGLPEQYQGVSNPFPWMSEILDLTKEKNFFESRVIDYQVGGSLDWDD